MSEDIAWPLLLGVLGLVFGSFIATVAIRAPAERSALAGRSACDGCRAALAWWDLVPLLSWTALRGRCRRCGGRIGLSHPVTEAIGLLIGVVAGIVAPGPEGAAGAVFGWLLLALGAIDVATFRLPNALTAALAVTGLATIVPDLAPAWQDRLIGGAAGFGALWLVARGYRLVKARDGLGGGDAKLFGAIGLWLGWRALPATLLAACALGLLWSVAARLRRDDRLPLGALLAVGGFAMWLWPRLT